jgi:hypothetical protein
MIGGNSLGDGKPKNTTADPAAESF